MFEELVWCQEEIFHIDNLMYQKHVAYFKINKKIAKFSFFNLNQVYQFTCNLSR